MSPFEEIVRALLETARQPAKTLERIERVIWMLLVVLAGALVAAGISLILG